MDNDINLMPVKMVIWDLDDTFWQGTLSEERIEYIPQNHDIVIELSQRGIVNSICSKNNFAPVRKVLQAHAIWDYFVMPLISWKPKGPAIRQLIEEINLREENVLFIDDNHLNLAEARYYSPDLQVAAPDIIPQLLGHPALSGKSDSSLSRLKQYQTLEKKISDHKSMSGSNEAFLHSCRITVATASDCHAQIDRLHELNVRTNQLNFTKERLSRQEISDLINTHDCEAKYLTVKDKYGDYGICGFYALRGGHLIQFLFSCRILGMGVEQWLYNKLGCPDITVKGETATSLQEGFVADWIHEDDSAKETQLHRSTAKKGRILVKGGCDLEQLVSYLGSKEPIFTEFNYQSEQGASIHTEHTEIIRRSGARIVEQYGDILDQIPFLDRNAYNTALFNAAHDVYIYSVLMDYTNGLYRYRQTDWLIPFGDFLLDITCKDNWNYLIRNFSAKGFDQSFLSWFAQEFTFIGGLSPDRFEVNIQWLLDRLPEQSLLIVLNGSEARISHPIETERHLHHRQYNRILERCCQRYNRLVVCDVRKFVISAKDVTDNIRHYKRRNYYLIAKAIEQIIASRLKQAPTITSWMPAEIKFRLKQAGEGMKDFFGDK